MKSICIIALCLVSFFAFSQTKNNYYQPQKQQIESPIYIYMNWRCELQGYWGSFWWKVTKQRIGNFYYYNVYVSSNSFFNERDYYGNYRKAITKVSDCVLWAKDFEQVLDFQVGTIVFDWESTYLYQFYTPDPRPFIKMKYNSVSPYDYSKKI